MSVILTTEDRDVLISVFFTGSDGGIVTFADTPEWHSADINVATVTAAADGKTAKVSAVGIGSGALMVTAETRGARFAGQLELTVIDPTATSDLDNEDPCDTVESRAVFVLRDTQFIRKLVPAE